MANTFKVHNAALGTTADTAVYTCPAATTAVVILCQVTNIDGTNAGILNMTHYDSSTTTQRYLASTISIPSDSAFNPIGGKLVLEAGDQLRAWASATGDLEIVVSVLQID